MRVRIIGAGPAGLYLAILLKKADRTHDVTVVERNPQIGRASCRERV